MGSGSIHNLYSRDQKIFRDQVQDQLTFDVSLFIKQLFKLYGQKINL
jgi:hypothetical protein